MFTRAYLAVLQDMLHPSLQLKICTAQSMATNQNSSADWDAKAGEADIARQGRKASALYACRLPGRLLQQAQWQNPAAQTQPLPPSSQAESQLTYCQDWITLDTLPSASMSTAALASQLL